MVRFIKFISTSGFWKHLIYASIAVILVFWIALFWLGNYTKHGKSIEVPDLSGLLIKDAESVLKSSSLNYLIIDSVYNYKLKKGAIVGQVPQAKSQVKEGRKIYLTINSMLPESVSMPDLVGKSKRIAIPLLEISGLKLEKTEYKQDLTCNDCVLEQIINGKPIERGTKVKKGDRVILVLGQLNLTNTTLPNLYGKTYEEAKSILLSNSLNLGEIYGCEECETETDSAESYIYKQIPEFFEGKTLRTSSKVDLYLTNDKELIDSNDSIERK
jgi:eukaryotic-like serine/threonine-protein kinase